MTKEIEAEKHLNFMRALGDFSDTELGATVRKLFNQKKLPKIAGMRVIHELSRKGFNGHKVVVKVPSLNLKYKYSAVKFIHALTEDEVAIYTRDVGMHLRQYQNLSIHDFLHLLADRPDVFTGLRRKLMFLHLVLKGCGAIADTTAGVGHVLIRLPKQEARIISISHAEGRMRVAYREIMEGLLNV